ncbi:MAG TPA: hypothetical protein VFX76_10130 [Roseiflexaceae bacterium]|nr:hypothetical protein [Roseiflexaceae bacterium]
MYSTYERADTVLAELMLDLNGCRIARIHQQAVTTVAVELGDAGDGPLRLIGEVEGPITRMLALNELPPWHDGRVIAWADLVGERVIVALESGNQFFLRAQSLRIERGV